MNTLERWNINKSGCTKRLRLGLLFDCFLTCYDGNRSVGGGNILAHVIVCGDTDGVHLATDHIIHGAVSVVGDARDGQALLCASLHRVVVSARRVVPQHLANGEAVLRRDVFRDAWLWKTEIHLVAAQKGVRNCWVLLQLDLLQHDGSMDKILFY